MEKIKEKKTIKKITKKPVAKVAAIETITEKDQEASSAVTAPQTEDTPAVGVGFKWARKAPPEKKTTIVRCIVIDKDHYWHTNTPVDLDGKDSSGYTWGYYGTNYPVLVEQEDGKLEPFYLPDAAGESSNRLYKGANPDGFRSTFRHRGNLLAKIQIGLMVTLVISLFFIMFLIID
jgi:hypothetical protein